MKPKIDYEDIEYNTSEGIGSIQTLVEYLKPKRIKKKKVIGFQLSHLPDKGVR